MKAAYHSTFTPSESDQETLESLLVAREDLVQGIIHGIGESARSENKHQRLLIGPRGIGKTHLVALVYHRVRADPELSGRLRIAWLQEDPYIASYPDLLLEILRALSREYELAGLPQRLDEILNLKKFREAALERLLLEILGERTLLLITENLDDLMRDLKEGGQHKLRAFLQNEPKVTILATSTSLVDAVAERKKAFYGFFRISTLSPLNTEQAAQLLARLADRAHDLVLAAAIRSPMGLARVRALHYLAGGNPRIYVLFYDFLSREALDELAKPLLKLVDELTPYYQARMNQLAPLQRRIIDILRRLRGASTVTEIARQTMSSPQSISSQLGKLKELGYVTQADSLGRSNYYELREPLMRLVLEVKEQQGRTVELFVQFLRVWYSEIELDRLASTTSADLEAAHLRDAVLRARSEQDPLLASLTFEFLRHQSTGNHEKALADAEVAILRAPGLKENWVRKAECLAALDRDIEEQLACWQHVAEIDPEHWQAWNSLGFILSELGRFEEALNASRRAVELEPENPILNRNYSFRLEEVGRAGEARAYREKTLSLSGEAATAEDWNLRGMDLWQLDRKEEALDAIRKALEADPHLDAAWGLLFFCLQEQGQIRLLYTMSSRIVELLPQEARLHSYLGTALSDLGRYKEALAAYESALRIDPKLDRKGQTASLYQAAVLRFLGRDREALEVLEQCEARGSRKMMFRLELAHANIQMWMDRWEEGRSELDCVLKRYHPPLWSGKNLQGFVATPLARSSNPEVWRPFITTWLASFGEHKCLTELGQGLVRSLRMLRHTWISDQTAQAWYQIWQELAGEIDEMKLPLRLLEAGVEYRNTCDPRALLSLPSEERGLLEPWLVNLFDQEPSEIDRKMEALLKTVERRLVAEAEAERARAFWESPVPDIKTLDFARLMKNYGDRALSGPSRLLPGSWKSLNHDEAECLLRLAAAHDEMGARAWSRPDLRVLSVARRRLPFSNWFLYHAALAEEDRSGALDVMASENQAVVLDGLSSTLQPLIERGVIHLETDEAQSEFTRFFSSILRAKEGRFQIVDGPADLPLTEGTALSTDARIQPWEAVEQPAENGGPAFMGTVLYGNSLFRATLRLSSPERGFVEMPEDEPLAQNLACRTERFDGPIRFLTDPLKEHG